ncbi:hypothetical protein PS687_04066 [Pseudomonas fluorescens]|nr:hypothetical protein PS687_04066 [Pseudomonas fluorescens]
MHKFTPNPPHASNAATPDAKLYAAAGRAIHHYFPPSDENAPINQPSGNLFLVSPNIDTETLLANAGENLASANEMAATLAFDLDDSQRSIALGIQQLIELSSLLIDRVQEQVEATSSTTTA